MTIAITIAIILVLFVVVSYRIGRRPLQVEKQIVVAAAPSRIFAALTEPELLVRWIGGLESSTALTEGGLRLGARSREVIVEHGRRIESESTVTALDRDRELGVSITGPGFAVDLRYTLAMEDGRTRVTHIETIRFLGLSAIFAPWLRGTIDGKLESDLERLKALAEAP